MALPAAAENAIVYSVLPAWIALLPLAGGFLVYRAGLKRAAWRDYGALTLCGVTLALAAVLFAICSGGQVVELRLQAGFLDPLLSFRVDLLGAIFTLLASFLWFVASLFSITYMHHEGERDRYYLFFLLSLGSCLGVFLAGDLLTLFFFFEAMTMASYVLVVHAQTGEAMEAGRSYIFLGVMGGLALLAAIMLLFFYTGSAGFAPGLEKLETLGPLRYLLAGLLICGFGIKAGMVPLHIWLPKAHPVAPSPASALLSGIMIKTGAYGIIRVVNILFTPHLPREAGAWATAHTLGQVMIWAGVATMFFAAFTALFQNNAKRILAYSSVSQMGYILMGIGTAAYLGFEGAIGVSGAVYHVINHAFFKASLFMLVGAVYVRTHRLDLRELGGLWRTLPVITIAFLVAAAGITGVPGLNGYTSKTLLHHAIVDAMEHGHDHTLFYAERIFTLTSALTVCYITKLTTGLLFGKKPAGLHHVAPETAGERAAFGLLTAGIVFLGGFPSLVMHKVILPAAAVFTVDSYGIKYLGKLNFWDHHDLEAIALVLAAGLGLFLLLRRRLYLVQLPGWLSIERLVYQPVIAGTGYLYTGASRLVETAVDRTYLATPHTLKALTFTGSILDEAAEGMLVRSLPRLRLVVDRFGALDTYGLTWAGRGLRALTVKGRDGAYNFWRHGLRLFLRSFWGVLRSIFFFLIRVDYNPRGRKAYQMFNVSNLDFDLMFIMVFFLALLLLWFIV